MKKLTIKQKKFADEYIISGNAYQAAINAGYSENYARNATYCLLENNGKISDYVNKKMLELDELKHYSRQKMSSFEVYNEYN